MKIIWDPLVKQQIEQLFRFNRTAFGSTKAKRIVESIYQHIYLLKKFPRKIYYTVDSDTIYIALIWDTRQDPQKLWEIFK